MRVSCLRQQNASLTGCVDTVFKGTRHRLTEDDPPEGREPDAGDEPLWYAQVERPTAPVGVDAAHQHLLSPACRCVAPRLPAL